MVNGVAKSINGFTKYEEILVHFSIKDAIKTGDSRRHIGESPAVAKTEGDKDTCSS